VSDGTGNAIVELIFRIAGVTGPSICHVIAIFQDGASQLLSAQAAFAKYAIAAARSLARS
jgi:hypothetical protein